MKKSIKRLALLLVSAALFSFKANPGGEGFEIYLGGKLLTQQFGSNVNDVRSVQLPQPTAGEELVIRYYHCGKVGTHRVITIRDSHDNLLRQFRYADGSAVKNGMSLRVTELMKLSDQKKGISKVKMYYSSSELPNGRWLASFEL
jgi:hypothetical protein